MVEHPLTTLAVDPFCPSYSCSSFFPVLFPCFSTDVFLPLFTVSSVLFPYFYSCCCCCVCICVLVFRLFLLSVPSRDNSAVLVHSLGTRKKLDETRVLLSCLSISFSKLVNLVCYFASLNDAQTLPTLISPLFSFPN